MSIRIRDLHPDDSIDSFIQTDIQADYSFVKSAKSVINSLVDIFHSSSFPYSVAKVLKHGSLGQGTALKDKSDIDLVVYINDMTIESLKLNMTLILTDMHRVIKRHFRYYKRLSKDEFRLGIRLKEREYTFDIDLLPGIPASDDRHDTYRELSDSSIPDHYSVTFAKQQRLFIKHRPTNLKCLFQLMKYWIKVDLKDFGDVKFPAYVMGLIVIYTWEKYDSPSYFDTIIGFKAVLKTLSQYRRIRKVWLNVYYNSSIWELFEEPSRNYLIDPANPSANVLDSVTDWNTVAYAARCTLRSPLLSDVCMTPDWKKINQLIIIKELIDRMMSLLIDPANP